MTRGSSSHRGGEKISWSGTIVSIQPRIRLTRSFDQRHHNYLGYVLTLDGTCGGEAGQFTVAIGEAALRKHQLHVGIELQGQSMPIADARLEVAAYYKTSGLKILARPESSSDPPPFLGVPPDLATYRQRGHRRLDGRTYKAKCHACIWGCRMPVEIIVDHWNPSKKKHRFETFCYGPKSCRLYRPGARRTVPGRNGMTYTEEDWVDEDGTAHREPDE